MKSHAVAAVAMLLPLNMYVTRDAARRQRACATLISRRDSFRRRHEAGVRRLKTA